MTTRREVIKAGAALSLAARIRLALGDGGMGPGPGVTFGGAAPPPSSQSGYVFFTPGPVLMTIAQNGAQSSEIAALAASYKQAGTGACIGYAPWYKWSSLEAVLNTYTFTTVDNDFLSLQSSAPGALFFPNFDWYDIGNVPTSGFSTYNPAGSGIPAYIISNSGTYGAGPSGGSSSYGGWMVAGYNGSNSYGYTFAAYYRSAIYNRILALFQAYANHVIPDGLGYTAATHPLIGGVGTSCPSDLPEQSCPNIPSDYTYEQANTGYQAIAAGIRQYWPQKAVWLMPGFGPNSFSGASDPTQQNTLLSVMKTNGVAVSCTDVFYPQALTYAQNYLIGNNYNGATGFQPSSVGKVHSFPSVQGDDYTSISQAQVTGILGVAYNTLGAQNVMLCVAAESDDTVPGFWNTYVLPVINAYTIPTANQLLPLSYMVAAQGVGVTPTGTTTANVTWIGDTNATNSSHGWTVYVNGVSQGGPSTASASSFAISGLVANTAYSITVAMSNANGAGPQSASFPYTTPLFYYANFASTSGLTLTNATHQNGNVISMLSTSGHDHGAFWYSTKVAPTNFQCNLSLSISGLPGSPGPAGMAFCIQNIPAGLNFVGDANMAGVGGAISQGPYGSQIFVLFDLNPIGYGAYPKGGTPSFTGLYTNGGPQVQSGLSLGFLPANDMNPLGINFYSSQGDIFDLSFVYDGSLLTMVMTNTTTNVAARVAWPLNLVGATNAVGNYVGMTTGGALATQATYNVYNINYTASLGVRLATPTFSPAPGEYSSTQSVTISGPAGASIYYTTNGLLPAVGGVGSTLYTGPISVTANEVIQAVAIESGFTDSLVCTGAYQIGTAHVVYFPSGFSAGSLIPVGYSYLSGSSYVMGDTSNSDTAGGLWFPVPVAVTGSWSTTFEMNMGGSNAGTGIGFCIQNNPPPVGAQTLTSFQWTGIGGQCSFASNPYISVGSAVIISGTGSTLITSPAYSNPTMYVITSITGTTAATLVASGGGSNTPLTTTVGTPSGVTFALNFNTIPGGPLAIGIGRQGGGYAGMDCYTSEPNLGALGLGNSLDVFFYQNSSSVGIYTEGAQPGGSQVSTGLNFSGGVPFNVTLSYNGSGTLALSMQATTGGTTFTHNFSVNIASTVDSTGAYGGKAYVGFLCGIGDTPALASIVNWTGF